MPRLWCVGSMIQLAVTKIQDVTFTDDIQPAERIFQMCGISFIYSILKYHILIYYCLTNNWFEVAWNHSGLTTFLYGYQFEIFFFVQTCTQSSHII